MGNFSADHDGVYSSGISLSSQANRREPNTRVIPVRVLRALRILASTDETWGLQTRCLVSRSNNLEDAIDFVGWHNDCYRRNQIQKTDTPHGHAVAVGLEAQFRNKQWLKDVAKKVSVRPQTIRSN